MSAGPERRAGVPGDQQIQRRLVDGCFGCARLRQEEAFSAFAFAIPAIFARQRPDSIGGILGRAVFLDEARGHLDAHFGSNGAGVLAAQTKGFQKTLPG